MSSWSKAPACRGRQRRLAGPAAAAQKAARAFIRGRPHNYISRVPPHVIRNNGPKLTSPARGRSPKPGDRGSSDQNDHSVVFIIATVGEFVSWLSTRVKETGELDSRF